MSTVAAPVKASGVLKVEVRRVIRASRQRVFGAWTKPEEMRRWFAPGPMTVAAVETEPREGGAYRIEMKGSMDNLPENADRRSIASGEYTEIVPNERLRFTWRANWNPESESVVTIHLRDVEGGTELLLIHDRIDLESASSGYKQGWTSCVAKLDAYLGG